MNTIPHLVATSNATADIAYYICIVSFFIAGGVAIYLLWDRIQQHNARVSRARVVKPTKKRAAKKSVAKKSAAKKPAKRTSKKK